MFCTYFYKTNDVFYHADCLLIYNQIHGRCKVKTECADQRLRREIRHIEEGHQLAIG